MTNLDVTNGARGLVTSIFLSPQCKLPWRGSENRHAISIPVTAVYSFTDYRSLKAKPFHVSSPISCLPQHPRVAHAVRGRSNYVVQPIILQNSTRAGEADITEATPPVTGIFWCAPEYRDRCGSRLDALSSGTSSSLRVGGPAITVALQRGVLSDQLRWTAKKPAQ